jgi:acetyl-CoA decarbonylase/synthase complex subunit gamma
MAEHRKSIREVSPIEVYQRLPRTNCGECGETNCMAFATRLVNREVLPEACPPILRPESAQAYGELLALLAPPVRAVTIGTGDRAMVAGGKYVLQRHEFTYSNPAPIALEVADTLSEKEREARVKAVSSFSYQYIGRDLTLDAIAVRAASGDPGTFRRAVRQVASLTDLPLILCTLDPGVMEPALDEIGKRRPLLYGATEGNWKAMADLALAHHCPLVAIAPGDIALLRSLVRTLRSCGIDDLMLDPGTFVDGGLAATIQSFTDIRRAAFEGSDDLLGYPLLGVPVAAWLGEEMAEELVQWKEACIAALLLTRYADLLVMHSLEGWTLLPQLIWRFNLYTDPRRPVSVEAGLRPVGSPDRSSPIIITTNYALTFFTVEADLKGGHVNCHFLVVDTGGISVESAVAGRYLTAATIASAVTSSEVGNAVDHRYLIIPGLAARLSGETEEATGWKVLVGPKDSSGLPAFLSSRWPPREEDT